MLTKLEERVVRICNELIVTIDQLSINHLITRLMRDEVTGIKYALEGKEDKENYILINFNGALEFIFNTYDFTEEEMGIILTTFLENNIKIINSKPYYYVEGIVGRKSYQEIVQDVKQCNPSFLILPNNTKEKYSEKLNEQIMSSEIKRKELVRTYGIILDFLTKEEKQEADYQNIYSILKSLQMPKFMIKIF